jgi:TnpA family transposase
LGYLDGVACRSRCDNGEICFGVFACTHQALWRMVSSEETLRNNVQHPTYKALSELGPAVKTIVLARYFARRGEVTSNRREDQGTTFRQSCMVYVKKLMLQAILAQPIGKAD